MGALIPFRLLQELGPRALFHYARYQLALRSGWLRRQTAAPPPPPKTPLRPLFRLPSAQVLRALLEEETRTQLLAEAESLLQGQTRLFGHFPVTLRWDPERRPRHWAEYATDTALLAPFFPPGAPPDIKFIWEPGRWGWAFTLGRAYHLTADERYAAAFWSLAENFLAANPPYLGPHWMNGQEVALRLMAMVWAAQVFAPSAHSTPARQAQLAHAVLAHAQRIPPTLDYALAQNNNHLLSEAAGLITAAQAFPDLPIAQRWGKLGFRLFNRALVRQISSYGEYIQHSTNYHRLMLHLALWVNAISAALLTPAARQALGRATHWLRSLTDAQSGDVPNLGANDGAYLFPLTSTPFRDFRPTVQAAARAFLHLHHPWSGSWDEFSLWLGLLTPTATAPSSSPLPPLAQQGYIGLSDLLQGRESWGYLRATSFRSRLAHSDQLHFDLWWRGQNIALDAGSGYYNLPPPWDNPLAAVRVHNTVLVDGREPRQRLSRFLSLGWFPAWSRPQLCTTAESLGGIEAWHRGYPGLLHQRLVTVYAGDRWEIVDRLQPRPARWHRYRLHWLLADGEWQLRTFERGLVLNLHLPAGAVTVRVEASSPLQVSLVRAGQLLWGNAEPLPYEGWYSPTYAMLSPALSLTVETESAAEMEFCTVFQLG